MKRQRGVLTPVVLKRWLTASRCSAFARCVRRLCMFGCISLIILYWYNRGDVTLSAAIPSMYVCAMAAGVQIGYYLKETEYEQQSESSAGQVRG